jgi:hypothetical protein
LNPVPAATGFCDEWNTDDWGEEPIRSKKQKSRSENKKLACLDDIMNDIELSSVSRDPWENFPALKSLMRDRIDWDTGKPVIDVEIEHCKGKGKTVCEQKDLLKIGPKDIGSGHAFNLLNDLWKEEGEPLIIKKEQLEESFINTKVSNMLNQTWE